MPEQDFKSVEVMMRYVSEMLATWSHDSHKMVR